jgi:imidazolonepropionase
MASLLIKNIKAICICNVNSNVPLRGKQMSNWDTIDNAYLLVENGIIQAFGPMTEAPESADQIIHADGKFLLPSFVDSHTHLVFAGSREMEFVERIKGTSYEEIINKGGGILNSAKKLANISEDELYKQALKRLNKLIRLGTGAIEIKSGYGLSFDAELKMLRVIKRIKENTEIPVKATFLGAHAIPVDFRDRRQEYIDMLINDLLPIIAEEKLADYIDVFCEAVAFSVEETKQIIQAGKKHGLKAKIHTNQFNSMGGIELCIEEEAISVDHLEVMNKDEINKLANSNVIGTMLPSAPFFLSDPYPEGRKMLDEGVALALASDYNPGSSPSGNMQLVIALSCIKSGLLPEESLAAATINGAFALELQKEIGSIDVGKRANFLLTNEIPSIAFLPYSFGENSIDQVFINGKQI